MFHETITAEGHLIDARLLDRIFDRIHEHGATYEVQRFDIGRRSEDVSFAKLRLSAPSEATLRTLIEALVPYGCRLEAERDARLQEAVKPGCVPEDFYSTTNHRTQIRVGGKWIDVDKQRMDAVIVVEAGSATCRKLRDVEVGDRIVTGVEGIRVAPELRPRDRQRFAFMNNEVSSERVVETSVARVAGLMREARDAGSKIAVVAGPVVIHTGGIEPFCELIRGGWVDVLLAGNAIAVHDIENSFYGTSLGVSLATGSPVDEGHKNHMRAINRINHAGSIAAAVQQGILTRGIMHACVEKGVEFVLAGSIRDDGPLPDTLMDLVEAQDRYAASLEGAGMVLMLSTMLHSIGVGNMLPSWISVVCVDINPAVVTKLSDRGSSQTIGIVTDVGSFLQQLAAKLR